MPTLATASLTSATSGLAGQDQHRSLRFALDGVNKGLTARLMTLLRQQWSAETASLERLERQLADQMPALVEQAFIAHLLQPVDGARAQRAMLSCLLSTVELNAAGAGPVDRPERDEMTSEAAAKLLHVSRTHLNTLVEAGELGQVRRTSGGHRRISRSEVLAYWARSKERQTQALDEMIEVTEELGLYELEREEAPKRHRRKK